MELLQALLSTTVEYFAGAASFLVIAVAAALAVGGIAVLRNRNKVVIEKFDLEEASLERDFGGFSRLVEAEIRRLIEVHLSQQEASGDLNIFRELAPQSSGAEFALELVPNELVKGIVKIALAGFGWLMRPPTLSGLVSRAGKKVTVQATVHSRGRESHQLDPVSRPDYKPELKEAMAQELGFKVIIHQSPDITVENWRALRRLSEAIERWPSSTQASKQEYQEAFKAIEAALLAARKHNPNSPLINYNLALLYYYRYKAKDNEEARQLFRKALRTDNPRLEALANIGLARCYSQDYHRFGKQSRAVLDKARDSAEKAVKLTEQAMRTAKGPVRGQTKIDYARALYCRAFAWHVTEELEDIERGIRDYERVIEITEPRVPAFVYNNQGYLYMARADRFVAGGDEAGLNRSAEYFNLALKREPDYTFALANLGNVMRLLGNYDEALEYYNEAVKIDPDYTNGWSELADVHLEKGEPDQAESAYEKALSLAGDDSHRSKVMERYARALYNVGREGAGLKLAREARDLNPDNASVREWLADVEARAEQSPASS